MPLNTPPPRPPLKQVVAVRENPVVRETRELKPVKTRDKSNSKRWLI